MAQPWGFTATLGAAFLSAGTASLVASQVDRPKDPGASGWVFVGVTLLGFGVALSVIAAVQFLCDRRARRRSPFEIVHDPNDEQCVQTTMGEGIQLRVRVRNIGPTGLIHVRARAAVDGGYEHWLRIRHDNSPPYDRSLAGEILPAREDFWLYFDVAYWDARDLGINIEFADAALRSMSKTQSFGRKVAVSIWGTREDDGTTVPEATSTFQVVYDRTPPAAIRLEKIV